MAAVETNTTTNSTLINIITGQKAEQEVEHHLNNLKELGLRAIHDLMSADQKKTTIKDIQHTT